MHHCNLGKTDHSWALEPLALRQPTVMSSCELASWAQIGKNGVQALTNLFGIRELTGAGKHRRYAVHDVLRQIVGVAPESSDDLMHLLVPLQKARWVSEMTGLSTSSISAHVCENRGILPMPIELTEVRLGRAPARCRRWVPAQIGAYLRGDPIPFRRDAAAAYEPSEPPLRNIFAAICADSARSSRQVQL